LHAAHELTDEEGRSLRLVHRDVSPQNLLVGVDGVAKLADFGVAKARSRLADETEAGQVKGKFAYMAPEQLERRGIDRRADVFSVGVVLWESLTGARLFGGVDLLETIAKVRESPIPDPRTRVASLPPPLAAVTMRALERDPAARFATAAEMSDALEEAVRAAVASATAREVGALVADLCADELERRRESVRDAVRAVTRGGVALEAPPVEVATQTTSAQTTVANALVTARGHRPGRRGVILASLAGLVLAGLLGMGLARRTIAETPASSPSAAPLPPAAAVSSPESSTPSPQSSEGDLPAALPAASATSTAAGRASAAPQAPPARPRRQAAPTPRVKYGNPYGP
jgi:serine/threonine-protein kinase